MQRRKGGGEIVYFLSMQPFLFQILTQTLTHMLGHTHTHQYTPNTFVHEQIKTKRAKAQTMHIHHTYMTFAVIPLTQSTTANVWANFMILHNKMIAQVHDFPPPRWPSGKALASRAEDPGFESRLRRDFFGVELYQ